MTMALLLLKQHIKTISGICQKKWGPWSRPGSIAWKHSPAPLVAETVATQLHVGDKVSDFVVEQIENIPEFQLTAFKLKHTRTGGEYLHIDRNDTNNAFSVGFRTTPQNSTGLPHILEHTTLTGSAKFPCRDPFFKMLNRSLATFMNAMTGPDFTIYPFSTQNAKDYENLMSVYLDAVFQPRLRKVDFEQEGWRLEHEDPQDPTSPIIIKGVVYNEMKGVFSDNQNIFAEALLNQILPSHTYRVCSGGDPLVIPSLTHKDLQDFHRQYYSPSNTKFFSYGNLPFTKHVKFIEREYLSSAKHERLDTAVPREKRWSQTVRKHVRCRPEPLAADPAKQSSIAISHLCCDLTDIEENFALQIISELLVKGPNASFYKTLIEPNIGAGFSPVTGYEGHTRDTYFTVGLQGVSEKDFETVVKLFDKTIGDVIEKGFEAKHVEGVLHGIELNTKHQSSDFGLGLLFGITPLWNHDGDIIELLRIEKHVTRIRDKIVRDPNYLQKKVQQYYRDNTHRLVLTMSPDLEYDKKQEAEERKILEEKVKSLDEAKRKEIYESGLSLLDVMPDNKECLPTLKITDLQKSIDKDDAAETAYLGVPLQVSAQPTNGVMYFRALLPTVVVMDELKPVLPLFTRVATKMGTKKYDYREFDQLVALKTGGITFETHLMDSPSCLTSFDEGLAVSSYCLNKNAADMLGLVSELFTGATFEDVNRFETLVKAHAADLVNSVANMGHHYAMLSAGSLVSAASQVKERTGGMTYVNKVKEFAQQDGRELLPKILDIHKMVMNRNHLRCAVNVLEGAEEELVGRTKHFIEDISGEYQNKVGAAVGRLQGVCGRFYVLPFAVSCTSKAVLTVPYQHHDFAALRVLTRLATMNYLHPEVREKGGAYGSGMNLSTSGVVSFYSYRDPNPVNTLKTFDFTLDWIEKATFTDLDIEEAKLGIFQGVDAPVPPGNKGMRKFLHGITDDMLERHRLDLMNVNKEQIIAVAKKYIHRDVSNVGRSVIGPENRTILSDSAQNWESIG